MDACAKLGDSKGAAQWLRKAHEELFVSLVLLQHGVIFGVVFCGAKSGEPLRGFSLVKALEM